MSSITKTSRTVDNPPPLWGSCRLTLTILCFFGIIFIYLLRLNFSMAIVCMTGTTLNETEGGNQAIEGEFDWSDVVVANLLGAFFYGYLCTQVIGGWVSDKFGEKTAFLSGMVANSILTLLTPVSARLHPAALFVVRVLMGFASGFTLPVVYNIFTTWSSPIEKATLFGIAFTGIPVASIINYPVSSLLCFTDIDGGWPMVFYIPGAACLVWCAFYYFFASNTPETHPRISEEEKLYLSEFSCKNIGGKLEKHPPIPWKEALLSIPVYAVLIAHFAQAWVFYLIALNIPRFIDEVFSVGIVYNGLLCAIPYVFVAISNLSGKLFDMIYKRQWVSVTNLRKIFNTIGMLGAALALILLPYFPSAAGQMTLISIAASLSQVIAICGFFTSHADLAGPFSGIFFGFTNTVAHFSGFLNPLVIAKLAPNGTSEEWQYVFYVGAGLYGLGAIVYLIFGTSERQPWAKVENLEANLTQSMESIVASDTKRESFAL